MITVEYISVNIKKNDQDIQCFRFDGNRQFESKIVQMANDATVFTSNNIISK